MYYLNIILYYQNCVYLFLHNKNGVHISYGFNLFYIIWITVFIEMSTNSPMFYLVYINNY